MSSTAHPTEAQTVLAPNSASAEPHCPICSAPSHPAFVAGEYHLYRCSACRTAFVHPVPTADELQRFYAKFHLSNQAGGYYENFEDRMQADFPAKLRGVLNASHGKPGRLLDVGCGKGFFVKLCDQAGLDAQGIDLSQSGVDYAVGTLGVKARCGDLHDAVAEFRYSFDTVTFWATVEHLPDPVATLRDIFQVLRPGGLLHIDTGIGDDWLDRMLPGRVQWYDPPQHLFVFSLPGLTRALESAGFQVIHRDPCFERSKLRKVVRIVRAAVVAALLRGLAFVGRLNQDGFVMTRFPIGNTMSLIARKPG